MSVLPNNIQSTLKILFEKHTQIESVILYGSRALGTARPGSDIDLCIVGQKCDLQLVSILKNELDQLNTAYLFDISIYHLIQSEALKSHIDEKGIIIYPTPNFGE